MQTTNRRKNQLRTLSRWARGGMSTAELDQFNGRARLVRLGLERASKPHSAQAIVEFMLISVPMLALIFGLMEFGIAYFQLTTLEFTTRDAARAVQVCGQNCDIITYTVSPTGTAGPPALYKDFYALQAVRNSNLSMSNIQYILIKHVGEDKDQPVSGKDEDYGRQGPDTYDMYPYHYQLYAPPGTLNPINTGVVSRSLDPINILLAETTVNKLNTTKYGRVQIDITSTNAPIGYKDVYNLNDNGWRSGKCPVDDGTGNTTLDAACAANPKVPPPNGVTVTGTLASGAQRTATWPGRFICDPTDRFYVQIAYRHDWITPFMPTLDTTSNATTLQGFSDQNYIVLNSKIYQKVEPILFSGAGGC